MLAVHFQALPRLENTAGPKSLSVNNCLKQQIRGRKRAKTVVSLCSLEIIMLKSFKKPIDY